MLSSHTIRHGPDYDMELFTLWYGRALARFLFNVAMAEDLASVVETAEELDEAAENLNVLAGADAESA